MIQLFQPLRLSSQFRASKKKKEKKGAGKVVAFIDSRFSDFYFFFQITLKSFKSKVSHKKKTPVDDLYTTDSAENDRRK